MNPSVETAILEQLTAIAAGVGELRPLVPRVAALEEGLSQLRDHVHDRALSDALEEIATLKRERDAAATRRREWRKSIALAVISAALGVLVTIAGVLVTAAATGSPRRAAPAPSTRSLGAGGAPAVLEYSPPR